jgi:hypothetical protein
VSRDQTDFTAASAGAYGPGTDIGYRNAMLARGGSIYGGSVFNTALPNQIPNQLAENVAPQLNTFTQSLTTANSGLGQFSGSIGDLAKGLLGGAGGGGGGLLSGIGSLFGFAEGGLIHGDGGGTSDSNLALVSDGEYIVSAGAVTKHRALLDAINSGKAPKFGTALPSVSSIISNVNASSDARQTQNHYTVTNNISTPNADSFRKSSGQIAADASIHIQRMGIRNG